MLEDLAAPVKLLRGAVVPGAEPEAREVAGARRKGASIMGLQILIPGLFV